MPRKKQPAAVHNHGVSLQMAKWFAILVTSGAALVSFLSDSSAIGLFGWFASEGLSLSDYVARSVRLSPAADTATAIGDSIHLAATVTDKRGSTLMGTSIVWTSIDPRVATVDSSGTVVVRSAGLTGIVAAVREYADTAWVVATQELTGVRIDIDSTFAVPEQESRQLFAMGVDSRRHEILGLSVSWTSSDTTVLRIDPLGAATGLVPGRVTVTASVDGMESQKTVRVVPGAGEIALVGSEQRQAAGLELPKPVAVRVWSRGGTPLEGALVRFYPFYGSGEVASEEVRTDAAGIAETRWTLGPTPGRQYLRVSVEGADSVLTIMAEADPHPSDVRVVTLNDSLTARFGQQLGNPVTIEVTDSMGRVLPDIPVHWSTKDGGSVDRLDARTDSLGLARALWTLGSHAGRQRAEAFVGNPRTIPPHTVVAWAEPGVVARAEIAKGNKQHGAVGSGLRKAVIVRAIDENDNPVPGVAVTVQPEHGTVPDSVLTTDGLGQVAIPWTLGRTSGAQRMAVRVDGVKASLVVSATADARSAGNIEFVEAPSSGMAGKQLRRPVVVRVTDSYGNPVADRQVLFSGPAGIVNPQRMMTGDDGLASTKWTLGSKKGRSWLQAVVKGTTLKAVMRIDVK